MNEELTEEMGSDLVRELDADSEMQPHRQAENYGETDPELGASLIAKDVIKTEKVTEPIHEAKVKTQKEEIEQSKVIANAEARHVSKLESFVLTKMKSLKESCASLETRRESLKLKRQSSSITTEPLVTDNEVEGQPLLSKVSTSSKSDSVFSKRPSALTRMDSYQSGGSPACNRASTFSVAASIQGNGDGGCARRASTYSVAASFHSASSSFHGRSNSNVALKDSFHAPWDSFGTELISSLSDSEAGPAIMRTFVTFDELVEDSALADIAEVCGYLAKLYDDPIKGNEYSLSWEVLSENLGKGWKHEEKELMND